MYRAIDEPPPLSGKARWPGRRFSVDPRERQVESRRLPGKRRSSPL